MDLGLGVLVVQRCGQRLVDNALVLGPVQDGNAFLLPGCCGPMLHFLAGSCGCGEWTCMPVHQSP
eukprot:14579045-Ditylum_brightwellii.AAC.1